MKELNLFLKMHFTSLSPDGQCISLAIISEDIMSDPMEIWTRKKDKLFTNASFYAEFTDFDLNRCDDWVKENIVSKISKMTGVNNVDSPDFRTVANISTIKNQLKDWLSQFSDYKLNFIVDCGWFTWGKFVELMGEWDETFEHVDLSNESESYKLVLLNGCSKERRDYYDKTGGVREKIKKCGLPKLPANFPPVPQDLNELISFKKGISVSEAFELDREELYSKWLKCFDHNENSVDSYCENGRFNALWDAKVTKGIYNKLK